MAHIEIFRVEKDKTEGLERGMEEEAGDKIFVGCI
jgi:hypothetical protein